MLCKDSEVEIKTDVDFPCADAHFPRRLTELLTDTDEDEDKTVTDEDDDVDCFLLSLRRFPRRVPPPPWRWYVPLLLRPESFTRIPVLGVTRFPAVDRTDSVEAQEAAEPDPVSHRLPAHVDVRGDHV